MNHKFLEQKEVWLQEQPIEVQRNTLLVENLAKYLEQNSPEYVASYLAECLRDRVWEDGFWDVKADGTFYIRTAVNALEFIRERLKMEPATLMNIIASPLPKAEDGAAAAIELVREVKAHEPETFSLLVDQENPTNWRDLLSANERRAGGPWIEASAELDKASIRRPGTGSSPVNTDLLDKVRAEKDSGMTNQAIADVNGVALSTIKAWLSGTKLPRIYQKGDVITRKVSGRGSTSRSTIRRKLERHSVSPELCEEKGTTVERVKAALIEFHNGKSAAHCEREAGLATSYETRCQLRVGGEATDVATRLIDKVKEAKARQIAEAILAQLEAQAA